MLDSFSILQNYAEIATVFFQTLYCLCAPLGLPIIQILSVVCSASEAYTSWWRGLKYSLKVLNIIQNYSNVANFFFSSEKLPFIWKKWYKNEWHICLVGHSFTKLSQNTCLINTLVLIYQYVKCDCKLWHVPWFYCVSHT